MRYAPTTRHVTMPEPIAPRPHRVRGWEALEEARNQLDVRDAKEAFTQIVMRGRRVARMVLVMLETARDAGLLGGNSSQGSLPVAWKRSNDGPKSVTSAAAKAVRT